MALITFSSSGLYCAQGNFYIDPWKPVDSAIITHAHSDHARPGNKKYLCTHDTKPLLKLRLGEDINVESYNFNEPVFINGVKISLHPAGHIIGSAQVRIEYKGEIWVFTGDFKTENDGISGKFEPVRCHNFITESTFALPIYKWEKQEIIYNNLFQWVLKNNSEGFCSIIFAYSLGKAQRVLIPLSKTGIKIFGHGAVCNVNETLINSGHNLPAITRISSETKKEDLKSSIVIAPTSAENTSWLKKFQPYKKAVCSGWMQVRGNVRRRNADAGFVLSDHADWPGLLEAINATGAQKVFTTHGFKSVLTKYLNEKGLFSAEVKTSFSDDEEGKEE
ncbi:MAG: ligase-associated DNA damage response exonuclease [Bacteroidetes bacterium]|nr:ligase-associated DNA damage response exonuclease [Bacteroidota bacterium]